MLITETAVNAPSHLAEAKNPNGLNFYVSDRLASKKRKFFGKIELLQRCQQRKEKTKFDFSIIGGILFSDTNLESDWWRWDSNKIRPER